MSPLAQYSSFCMKPLINDKTPINTKRIISFIIFLYLYNCRFLHCKENKIRCKSCISRFLSLEFNKFKTVFTKKQSKNQSNFQNMFQNGLKKCVLNGKFSDF